MATLTDRFGHGCAPVPYDWTEARTATGLSGYFGVARLALPFTFPFYGVGYRTVWISAKGVVSFAEFTGGAGSPGSTGLPNAAIFALSTSLTVDAGASVTTAVGPSWAVVSYNHVQVGPEGAHVSFQIRLDASGDVDMVYRDTAGADSGAQASIGIENADGTDALVVGDAQPFAPSGTAWRYTRVATTEFTGVVRNANDGIGISGATVTALPGGRTARTDADGRYRLAVIPGRYAIAAGAPGYGGISETADSQTAPAVRLPPLSLPAARVLVEPERVEFGPSAGSIDQTMRISNLGALPLSVGLYERDEGNTATPAPPPAPGAGLVPLAARDVALAELATDPPTDGFRRPAPGIVNDLVGLDGGSDGRTLRLRLRFTGPDRDAEADIWLDTDRNTATGRHPYRPRGHVDTGLGVDYTVSFPSWPSSRSEATVRRESDSVEVGRVRVTRDQTSATVDVPVALLGPGGRGDVNVVAEIIDSRAGPVDWVPDTAVGHVVPELDPPWLYGADYPTTIGPGSSTLIRLSRDSRITGADRWADVRIETSDPRRPTIRIPVHLHPTATQPPGSRGDGAIGVSG